MSPSVTTNALSIEEDVRYDFGSMLVKHELTLWPLSIETLQVNITRLCNQACRHCHVGASPRRTEQMDRCTVVRCLEILAQHDSIRSLDVTGGSPELNPNLHYLAVEARKLNKNVKVRHNLTVTFDGDPVTGEEKRYLPEFFAEHQIEVIASLPYHQEYFTDKQRGKGVFSKSIEGIRLLNAQGYGKDGTGLVLNLVYNPVGAFLLPDQASLEADFRQKLLSGFGVVFNNLYTIANVPINRFRDLLDQSGNYDEYMTTLVNAFNPAAAKEVMCRSLVSVGYDGRIYDCDFNQMLELQIVCREPMTVFSFDYDALMSRGIRFEAQCFGCTAGTGSSCAGALA